jgi:hypothetical protein
MMKCNFILACGSIPTTPEQTAVVYVGMAIWGLTLLFTPINLIFLASQSAQVSGKFIATNYGLFISYVALGIILFAGGFMVNFTVLASAVLGIPVVVISHFCYLFLRWRKLRKRGLETHSDKD